MERAAGKIFSWLTSSFSRSRHFMIFTGPGNNGGDGLALARMLSEAGYHLDVFCIRFTEKTSRDWEVNRKRLESDRLVKLNVISDIDHIPLISPDDIVIDAIFGSGLKSTLPGLVAEVIDRINDAGSMIIAVDMPSGLFCENNNNNDYKAVVKASHTLSFQFPKLAFMFAENDMYVGDWHLLDIGLSTNAIHSVQTPYRMVEMTDILPLIKSRRKFSHKGDYGHGLIVSGSFGKMGAAVMSAEAALRTGIGLISCQVPGCGYTVLQVALPEAMVLTDTSERMITDIVPVNNYDAVGIGPGIGTGKETMHAVHDLLINCLKPLVIDADGLNIISLNKEWLRLMQPLTILTPHPKEFDRLAGECPNGYTRLMKQIEFSSKFNCIVVLKGACTSVSLPDGSVYFNSTGNPGMATGGSGDVLAGMILSLLAQGYSPQDASVAAVYIHGLAGDIAASENSMESIIASDIINCIGKAFNVIGNNRKTTESNLKNIR
jgi:NAD(P)H-hydrate epimerase